MVFPVHSFTMLSASRSKRFLQDVSATSTNKIMVSAQYFISVIF